MTGLQLLVACKHHQEDEKKGKVFNRNSVHCCWKVERGINLQEISLITAQLRSIFWLKNELLGKNPLLIGVSWLFIKIKQNRIEIYWKNLLLLI